MGNQLFLNCDPVSKGAFASLFSQAPGQTPNEFSLEQTPLSVSIIEAIQGASNGQFWNPELMTDYTVRAAIGNAFLLPVAGTWFIQSGISLTSGTLTVGKWYQIISYGGSDSFTNVGAASNATGVYFQATGTTPTTWAASVLNEITASLEYNCLASDVQTALNATGWITSAGGVVVSLVGTAAGYFVVTFNDAGARNQMTAYTVGLAPLSYGDVSTLITGTTTPPAQCVETIRILQQPAAYANLSTDSGSPSAVVTQLTAGGIGNNEKDQITLGPTLPYGGYFSVTIGGLETPLQGYNVTPASLQTALQALQQTAGPLIVGAVYLISNFVTGDNFSNVGGTNATGNVFTATGTTPTNYSHGSTLTPTGSGNVAVFNPQPGVYVLGFQGQLADVAIGPITADGSALQIQTYKSGVLSTNTEAMEILLGGASSVATTFEIEATPSGGSPQKVFRATVQIIAPLIFGTNVSGPSVYFINAAQIAAIFASYLPQWTYVNGGASPAPSFSMTSNNDSSKNSTTTITLNVQSIGGASWNGFFTTMVGSRIIFMGQSGGDFAAFTIDAVSEGNSAQPITLTVTIAALSMSAWVPGIYAVSFAPAITQTFLNALMAASGTALAQGQIFYVNGSGNVVQLAAGTSGEFLQTQGSSSNPQWATVSTAFSGVNTQTANYVLALSDAQGLVLMNSASNTTVTIPPNSSVAFPVGTKVAVAYLNVATQIVAGAGVTLNLPTNGDGYLLTPFSQIVLTQTAANVWSFSGLVQGERVARYNTPSQYVLLMDSVGGTYLGGSLTTITDANINFGVANLNPHKDNGISCHAGGVVAAQASDVSTTHTDGTTFDTLYSFTIAGNTVLANSTGTTGGNGQALRQFEHISTVSSVTATRQIQKFFAGTKIFDSGSFSNLAQTEFDITTFIYYESSTVARCFVSVDTSLGSIPPSTYTRITSMAFSSNNALLTQAVAGGTGAASGDITECASTVEWLPNTPYV